MWCGILKFNWQYWTSCCLVLPFRLQVLARSIGSIQTEQYLFLWEVLYMTRVVWDMYARDEHWTGLGFDWIRTIANFFDFELDPYY